jgi:hypothetical protein
MHLLPKYTFVPRRQTQFVFSAGAFICRELFPGSSIQGCTLIEEWILGALQSTERNPIVSGVYIAVLTPISSLDFARLLPSIKEYKGVTQSCNCGFLKVGARLRPLAGIRISIDCMRFLPFDGMSLFRSTR